MMLRLGLAVILVVTLGFAAAPAWADTLFHETFDTNTANTATTLSTYSGWTVIGTTPVTVVNGVVQIEAQGDPFDLQGFALPSTFTGDLTIEVDLGTSTASGSYNVGLKIGDNNIVFHPGYTVTPGAFRVEGPGGFGGPGDNRDMGFVPAAGVLHHMTVNITAATGLIEIEVVDANDATNVYTTSITNSGYTDGAQIAFTTNGNSGFGYAQFDNIKVSGELAAVPEPGTLALLGVGLACILVLRRRRSAA
ncbi:MAG: PEP-CTERM sorting domain-containing protein [Planctomycetota bacterium]|nr:PEP-CTERM sorting domain-containing protein [Planctomycetota bacterium]